MIRAAVLFYCSKGIYATVVALLFVKAITACTCANVSPIVGLVWMKFAFKKPGSAFNPASSSMITKASFTSLVANQFTISSKRVRLPTFVGSAAMFSMLMPLALKIAFHSSKLNLPLCEVVSTTVSLTETSCFSAIVACPLNAGNPSFKNSGFFQLLAGTITPSMSRNTSILCKITCYGNNSTIFSSGTLL